MEIFIDFVKEQLPSEDVMNFEMPQGLSIGDALYVNYLGAPSPETVNKVLCVGYITKLQVGGLHFESIINELEENAIEGLSGEELLNKLQSSPWEFYFYALPRQSVNKSSVKGYFAKAVWRNNERLKRSELFVTTIGAVESSK